MALTGFVVSIIGRRRYRRLHHLARCGLIPRRDYLEFEVHGDALPPADAYDSVCARCWRPGSSPEAEARRIGRVEPDPASSSGESSPEGEAA